MKPQLLLLLASPLTLLVGCARCGDGEVDEGEACDDANDSDFDSCRTSCLVSFCGDGFIMEGVEECDNGNLNSNTNPSACRVDCTLHAPPVPTDDSLVVDEDSFLTFEESLLLANDTDANNDPLTVGLIGAATNGVLTRSGSQITFTPDPDFSGTATFTYEVSDGLFVAEGLVTLTVNQTNDPPVPASDSLQTGVGVPLTIPGELLLENDLDPEGDELTVLAVANATNGSAELIGGQIVFTPNSGFHGQASFEYAVGDGIVFAASLVFVAVDDPPVAADDAFTIEEDSSLQVFTPALLANDDDINNDPVFVISVGNATHGLVVREDNRIVFLPDEDFFGEASFEYTVRSGAFLPLEDTALVTVTVTPRPDCLNGVQEPGELCFPRRIPTGGARMVAAGDLTGDGKGDLVVTGVAPAFLGAFFGRSEGDVSDRLPVNTLSGVSTVALADLNGDAVLDLALPHANQALVSVNLGSGDGLFSAPKTFNAGQRPLMVVTGDFSGDTVPDLVILNGDPANKVSVLPGNGDGTFGAAQAAQTTSTLQDPKLMVSGDFTGDGLLDVFVAASNQLRLHPGNGDGTLGARTPIATGPVGDLATSILAGDFSNDGELDLVLIEGDLPRLRLGQGNGDLGAPVSLLSNVSAESVAAGDFNGDGALDLAVTEPSFDFVTVLLGNGNGTFQPPRHFATGSGPTSIAVTDVNGDGALDLGVSNGQSVDLSVLLGDGAGSFSARVFRAQVNLVGLFVDDRNGDLAPDLVVGESNTRSARVLLNDGAGLFSQAQSFSFAFLGRLGGEALNLDSLLDVTTARTAPNAIGVSLSDGAGGFGALQQIVVSGIPGRIAAGTINGDPFPDIIATQLSSPVGFNFIPGGSTGFFGAAQFFVTPNAASAIAIGDLNGDGLQDLLVPDINGNGVFLRNGDGTFQLMPPLPLPPLNDIADAKLGDLNQDGHLDVVVRGEFEDTISAFLGVGDGTFLLSHTGPTPGGISGLSVADLDLDGVLDIAVTMDSQTEGIGVLQGNGDGTFGPLRLFSPAGDPHELQVRDLNGDGRPDAVMVLRSGDICVLLAGPP